MALVMRTAKGAVSFECSDEDAETVVKIEPTDTDEVMLRKLKRVIALVEGEQATEPANWRDALGPQRAVGRAPGEYSPGGFLAPSPPPGVQASIQTGNGWAAYAEPKVPEHLAGEIEVIKPGEEA